MKKNVQKLLSIVLTVIMMISMLPFSVFAADLDVYDVEEPAVEAVSVPAEEQEIESTVEDVLVGNAETEDELLVEDAEIVEDSSEEIETVDAADPAEADADVVIEESETDETLGALNEGYVDVGGNNFPNSFTYSGNTYTKSGNPVALNASYRIEGLGQTNWLNEYGLNGLQQVNPGKIYYQVYTSGRWTIVVYEIPSLIEVMQGTGLYMSPQSLYNGMVDVGQAPFDSNAASYRVVETGGAAVAKGVIKNLTNGNVTYGFTRDLLSSTQSGTINVKYTVRSGSDSYIRPTYTITYKDGVDDEVVFEDQVWKDDHAVGTHNTPHFKWPNKDGENADPDRNGYRFVGWKDQNGANRGNSDAVARISITGDATYTAEWERVSVTVTKAYKLGADVEAGDVDHTVHFALYDNTKGEYVKVNGQPLIKSVTITDGVVSDTAVFGVDELIPGHDLSVREVHLDASGAIDDILRPANSAFTNSEGKALKVSKIQAAVTDASGSVIVADNTVEFTKRDSDESLPKYGKDAYVTVTNTYATREADIDFEVTKKWVDYKGDEFTPASGSDYSATIGLYKKVGDDGAIEKVAEAVLNGTESTPWVATFNDLPATVYEGEDELDIHYMVKEESCTPEDFKAYKTGSNVPMADDEYVTTNHSYIYNKQDSFTIVHSSNASEEKLPCEPIDLTKKVVGGYLYGGYYHYDNGAKGVAYVESGITFVPTSGTTYYLKEVPDTYLRPQVYVLFNKKTNELTGLYAMTAIDEELTQDDTGITGGYLQSGLVIDKTPTSGTPAGKLEFKRGDAVYASLTSSSVFSVAGDLSYVDAGIDWSTRTISAYYVTPDSVKVTGIREREFNIGDGTFKGWTSDSTGLKQTANKAVKTTAEVYSISSVNGKFSRRVATIKVDPDNVTAVITKVEDGKKYTQTVEKGDNTGKVAYSGKNNYVFAGWYTDAAYTTVADFSNVTGDMTVYAKYVKASNFKLTFAGNTVKDDAVTLKSTLKITGEPNIADAAVACELNGNSYIVEFTSQKTTKSGKTSVDTYTGTVQIEGLANGSVFTAVISYKTADGTIVNVNAKKCTYKSGLVTVK